MIREIIAEANSRKDAVSYKGGKDSDEDKITNLVTSFDFYTERIESYAQQLAKEKKNDGIKKELKKLGVKEISNGDVTKKI